MTLGNQTLYPFLIQPKVASGTTSIEIPQQWIWDFHASLPKKWENLRLAKIKRISGENALTGEYTGFLRLIFTANVLDSSAEVSIFSADYHINSALSYQPLRLVVLDSSEESIVIDQGEAETVAGNLIFRTLDTELEANQSFFDLVAPVDLTDLNNDGYYDNPAVYEIVDSVAGGGSITGDYSLSVLSHGTGLLTDSAWNLIPELDSDIQSWIASFNYPFDSEANRRSEDGIVIPSGLFREFNIVAPASDEPDSSSDGRSYPVWISRIQRVSSTSNQLRFYFATYAVTEIPSTVPVEFATLDLFSSYVAGQIVEITPYDNLFMKVGVDAASWQQGFGRGHVVLSSLWGTTTTEVADFFDAFDSLISVEFDTIYPKASTRISSFGANRVPKYIPTYGQSQALVGSSGTPSDANRYITEADQGTGDTVDLEAQPGISSNSAIDRYGYTGALAHRVVKLIINSTNLGDSANFYDTHILPRLRILLGRDPIFGDFWYNGTRLMFFNGDTWQG